MTYTDIGWSTPRRQARFACRAMTPRSPRLYATFIIGRFRLLNVPHSHTSVDKAHASPPHLYFHFKTAPFRLTSQAYHQRRTLH